MKPLSVILALALLFAGCSQKKPRAVILISLDTLRQDHLGCYGYGRDTSPCLDRFARADAVLLDSAYAQAPYTLPSHMSMMTGLYPEAHRVLTPVEERDGKRTTTRLCDGFHTLAESFRDHGFRTEAFTDGGLVEGKFGFDQGFEAYHDERDDAPRHNGFRRFGPSLHRWIRDHADEDFFLFIHTFDIHAPYDPPEPFRSKFAGKPPAGDLPHTSMVMADYLKQHEALDLFQYEDLQAIVDRYDGGIAYADSEVGALFDVIKELGLWDEALILVTSDHGENFLENGFHIGHGLSLYEAAVKIPALLKLPHSRHGGRAVDHLVETVDFLPTILGAMKIPLGFEVQGQDIVKGMEEGIWRKDLAYGVSPSTGENHYLIKDGIKFIEGEDRSRGFKDLEFLQPLAPPGSNQPWLSGETRGQGYRYYDFTEDPLGLVELFFRGDRAFQALPSLEEWKTDAVEDPALLTRYLETACRIAEASEELGKRFVTGSRPAADLSEDDRADLEALGYGGLIDSTASGSRKAKDRRTLEIKSPLVDRSLLDQGDVALWQLLRLHQSGDLASDPTRSLALGAEAREKYERFREEHPDRPAWVRWRLGLLDDAIKALPAREEAPEK